MRFLAWWCHRRSRFGGSRNLTAKSQEGQFIDYFTMTIPTSAPCVFALYAALLSTSGFAEKATQYYPDGMSNPNVNERMYWADSSNVLNDIDKFDALYVTHHSCAWSPYVNSNNEDFQCGIEEAEDEELWYMNLAPCYRAQTAYSLYGILKGDEDTGCNKKTFINSFFTSAGFEAFTTAVASSGITFQSSSNTGDDGNGDDDSYPGGISSQCEAEKVNDDDNNNNGYGHNQKINQGYTSYGVTCTSTGAYVQNSFAGASCTQSAAITTTNNLQTFNQDIVQAVCVPIYKPSSGSYYNQNQDGNENDPINLLMYSLACSIREFPGGVCPDPYGKLRAYENQLEASTGFAHNQRRESARKISSWVLFVLGSLLLVSALTSHQTRAGRKQQRNKSTALKTKRVSIWKRFTNMFHRNG